MMIMMITKISEYVRSVTSFSETAVVVSLMFRHAKYQPQGLFTAAHSPWKVFFRWLASTLTIFWYLLRSCTLSGALFILSKIFTFILSPCLVFFLAFTTFLCTMYLSYLYNLFLSFQPQCKHHELQNFSFKPQKK